MKIDSERFEHLTAGLRNLAVISGLLIGGAWTLWTFNALGARARADAELFEQATVDIKVEAMQEDLGDGRFYVCATATVTNSGNRNTFLDFEAIPPWTVSQISHDGRGFGTATETTGYPSFSSAHRVLRRTESARYPLFVEVAEPGLYLVRFRVPLSATELKIHNATAEELGHDPARAGTITWSGFASLVVRPLDGP